MADATFAQALAVVGNGIVTPIDLIADNAGAIGNAITIVGDDFTPLGDLVAAWNVANPTNTLHDAGDDTQVPTALFHVTLTDGHDAVIVPPVVLQSLASYSVSKKPTTQAKTNVLVIPLGVNTLVAEANTNRSYLTLRNENGVALQDARYDYFDNPAMLTKGFLLKAGEAVDVEAPQAIYMQPTIIAVGLSTDEGSG